MADFLILLLFVTCIACAIQGLLKPERVYEPLLPISTVFIGFVLLQLHGLWLNEWRLPVGSLDKTAFMAFLCLIGFWWGYSRRVRPLHFLSYDYDLKRLFLVSLGLSLFGATFFFLISRLPKATLNSQWSGLPVAYLFFAQTLSYGFALACLLWARFRVRGSLWVALFGASFYFDRIIIAGRRGTSAEFFFIIVLAIFFGRGKTIPRFAMCLLMTAMILAMHSTGSYRSIAYKASWNAPLLASSIDFFANLRDTFLNGGEELKNAVYMIEAYDQTAAFDFGLSHWNEMIFNYVPAQLVGADVKAGLQVDLPDVAASVFSYRTSIGSTVTGMVDSFASFWYLGAIKFVIIGLILRKIWEGAKAGSLGAQLLYMLLITKALHVVTHHTNWFLSPWVHMAVFFFPLLLWARRKAPTPMANCNLALDLHSAP